MQRSPALVPAWFRLSSDCELKSIFFWHPDWFLEVWKAKKHIKFKSDPNYIWTWFEIWVCTLAVISYYHLQPSMTKANPESWRMIFISSCSALEISIPSVRTDAKVVTIATLAHMLVMFGCKNLIGSPKTSSVSQLGLWVFLRKI